MTRREQEAGEEAGSEAPAGGVSLGTLVGNEGQATPPPEQEKVSLGF